MIRIHQAIYGDLNGGYSLLNSSFSKTEIPIRLGNSTDPIDRPPDTILTSPIIRGFKRDDYFLLVKSFPDQSLKVRRGRVFSHALFIEKKDFLKIQDITTLMPYFLDNIDKEANLNLLKISSNNITAHKHSVSGQIACAINALVEHVEYDHTIVWIGEDGYFEWISQLWPALPNAVKLNIRLGTAFDPKKVNTDYLNLKYVPFEFKMNWSNTNFKLIEPACDEAINSQTANLLTGNEKNSQELQELLQEFSLVIEEIDDLKVLETMLPVYKDGRDLKDVLNFAHLISRYSVNPKTAFSAKAKLLQSIGEAIKKADADEIIVIANPNWSGFANAQNVLSAALTDWLNKNLMSQTLKKGGVIVIEKAMNQTSQNWWSKTVLATFSYLLKHWKSEYAKKMWDWFTDKPDLIKSIGSLLPSNVERDLVSSFPNKLKKAVAEPFFDLARSKKWLHLHGLLALQLFSPKEAFTYQLVIDTNIKHNEVLKEMASNVKDQLIITIAVDLMDSRLITLAGERCLQNPELLADIKIKHRGWQELWRETVIKQGLNVWDGVKAPNDKLYEVMDQLLGGHSFNLALLEKISISSYNDLKDYPNREKIWASLPADSENNFLQATSLSCVKSLLKETLSLNTLEKPLLDHIKSQSFIHYLLSSKEIGISSKLALIDKIPGFREKEVIQLIDSNQFSKIESTLLGHTIQNRDWYHAAKHCNRLYFWQRSDLRFALEQCIGLLLPLQRIGLSIRGFSTNTVSRDDCWTALIEIASELYPYGPDQNGIWETAGGQNSDLIQKATGKEQWNAAVYFIKKGGQPNVKSLINTMLSEYSNDLILKFLQREL